MIWLPDTCLLNHYGDLPADTLAIAIQCLPYYGSPELFCATPNFPLAASRVISTRRQAEQPLDNRWKFRWQSGEPDLAESPSKD